MDEQARSAPSRARLSAAGRVLLTVILLPVMIVLVPVAGFAIGVEALRGVYLRLRFRLRWGPKRIALIVYSDSPHWKTYIEERWLPLVAERAVVLNWSERRAWMPTRRLEAAVFRHYAGQREFNPVAIVLAKGKRAEVVRFWQPFRDFRHGKVHTLRQAEERLGSLLGIPLSASEPRAA
jgi:hypothetical protein